VAALGLNRVRRTEIVDSKFRVPTKGGHGGPPLQYVPNDLNHLGFVLVDDVVGGAVGDGGDG